MQRHKFLGEAAEAPKISSVNIPRINSMFTVDLRSPATPRSQHPLSAIHRAGLELSARTRMVRIGRGLMKIFIF